MARYLHPFICRHGLHRGSFYKYKLLLPSFNNSNDNNNNNNLRYISLCMHSCTLYSSAGIATGYGLDGPGIESRWGEIFADAQTGPGAHPASCTMGTESFPGVKRSGRGADHPSLLVPRSSVPLYYCTLSHRSV
jgi:hypothetical protein